jgi:hypothetical protein
MAEDPATVNFTLKRGASFYEEIDCYIGISTAALDISTFVLESDLKSIPAGGVIASLNATCSTAATNKLVLSLASSISATLPTSGVNFDQVETYYHDIKVNTGTNIEYWWQGTFSVTPSVTT